MAGAPLQRTAVVVAGPTAVGKTAVALQLAEALGTEILSADSRQCYRGMPIGTAQPTAAELARVPHHFIAELPVEAPFSAADYERYGLAVLDRMFEKAPVAVVCGGTGLYLKALCDGLDDTPAVDPAVAAAVSAQYQAAGLDWLQACVREEDPQTYAAIDGQNPARLLRALAFRRSTGQSLAAFQKGGRKERPFRILRFALELPRPVLYNRIDARVDAMLDAGLLEEARALYPHRNLKALQTVGYAELFRHFDGDWSLDEAVTKIKQHTRNYAKRQLTWFRNDGAYEAVPADTPDLVTRLLARIGH